MKQHKNNEASISAARVSNYCRRLLGAVALLVVAMAGSHAMAGTQLACRGVQPPPDQLPGAETFSYRTIDDRTLLLHLLRPVSNGVAQPVVLMFYGGGFVNGDPRSLLKHAHHLVRHGYAVALADYRVRCRDDVTPVASIDDAVTAYEWLRQNAEKFDLDTSRFVISGGSAGGFLATSVALKVASPEQPAALVLFNPAIDLVRGREQLRLSATEAEAISLGSSSLASLPPTIVFHGTADQVVPIQEVRDFCRRAGAAGSRCELVEFDDMPHSFYQISDLSGMRAICIRHKQGGELPPNMPARFMQACASIESAEISPFDDTMNRAVLFLNDVFVQE